jgi:hypothetical protein
MSFDSHAYGEGVASILRLDGDGHRLLPLASARPGSDAARAMISAAGARHLFPRSRAPEAAMAGLYLYFDWWNEAHETAQEIDTREGSYWHAIVHRMEPDAGNAGYWFRRVGTHAIFPALRDAAAAIGLPVGQRWSPEAFVELCERAAAGSDLERQAREVQRAEWQLLFDYCAL